MDNTTPKAEVALPAGASSNIFVPDTIRMLALQRNRTLREECLAAFERHLKASHKFTATPKGGA